MFATVDRKTEIIAISSGKGGTGKTIIAACLGYALTRAGHEVLLIDADPGTDGLSLFLLGPDGIDALDNFEPSSTVRGVLEGYRDEGIPNEQSIFFKPRSVNRKHDHGVVYTALISGRGLYGDIDEATSFKITEQSLENLKSQGIPDEILKKSATLINQIFVGEEQFRSVLRSTIGDEQFAKFETLILRKFRRVYTDPVVPRLTQTTYHQAVGALFEKLRSRAEFDYVIVDTRGGFAFESTDICALADSFIIVTEPDYTSFYQDRNLVTRINQAAHKLETEPLLRAIVVNKATHGEESSFRLALEREFPIKFSDTYAVPLDLDAIRAYRDQQIPYVVAPESDFSFATMRVFARIMGLVTGGWEEERIDKWNDQSAEIGKARYSFLAITRRWLRTKPWAVALTGLIVGSFAIALFVAVVQPSFLIGRGIDAAVTAIVAAQPTGTPTRTPTRTPTPLPAVRVVDLSTGSIILPPVPVYVVDAGQSVNIMVETADRENKLFRWEVLTPNAGLIETNPPIGPEITYIAPTVAEEISLVSVCEADENLNCVVGGFERQITFRTAGTQAATPAADMEVATDPATISPPTSSAIPPTATRTATRKPET